MGIIDWNQIHNADVDFIANDEDAAEAYFELLSAVSWYLVIFEIICPQTPFKHFYRKNNPIKTFFQATLKTWKKLKRPFTVCFWIHLDH